MELKRKTNKVAIPLWNRKLARRLRLLLLAPISISSRLMGVCVVVGWGGWIDGVYREIGWLVSARV